MPPHWWECPELWKNEVAFVVGGGSSLIGFDWSLLADKKVIGCNDAYLLGEEIVDVCCFGDHDWYKVHKKSLADFKGLKVTCNKDCIGEPNIMMLERRPREMPLAKRRICWHTNTGTVAIHLAAKFGCSVCVLLGFDMKLGKFGESNWHKHNVHPDQDKDIYRKKFLPGFECFTRGLMKRYPDFKVYNATEGSELKEFPMLSLEKALTL